MSTPTSPPPAQLGRYKILRRLGAGGMAEVFVAEAVGLLGSRRLAAVKCVRRDLVENAELCSMFLEEARLAAQLHHPNIVEVLSFGTGGRGSHVRPYIAMELIDGLPLAVLLRHSAAAARPLPLAAVSEIGIALASALHHAHTLRSADGQPLEVVHRDVSPHNVLISRTGEVKLIDFGIARAASRATHTKTGHMRGKLAYAAPEQVAGTGVDARTDVFALGVLLYEAATLTRPFTGDSEPAIVSAILEGRRKAVIELRADATPLAAAIERAMNVDPKKRWQTAHDLEAALKKALPPADAGPSALAELVTLVERDRRRNASTGSAPLIELAPATVSSGPPSTGDTATVADRATER